MSTSPVTSPIQRLSFDVLLHIFDINADIFEDATALKTTLATSLVCHDWRVFLLSSTSIWAHVIDLDRSLWLTVEGSREMIRRSGTSFMWIKVPWVNHNDIFQRGIKHILNILDTNWERIQRLEVAISVKYVHQWQPLFRRPAPHLQSFRFIFVQNHDQFNDILSSLFSGNAPMLHDFYLEGPSLNPTTARWMQQIRHMELSDTVTVARALGVLSLTTNLTNLRLYLVSDNDPAELPFVSLPKLVHLNLNLCDKLTTGSVLLEHIYIPPRCTVTFSTQQIRQGEIDKENTFGPIIGIISSCAQRCLAHHLPQRLHIVITPSSFIFRATNPSDEPYFYFHLNMASRQSIFPGHTLTTLLKGFSLPSLSKVTFLEFRMTRVLHQVPGLTTLIACLPSVNTISTEKLSLRHLHAYAPPKGGDKAARIIFPVLKTLKLFPFAPSLEERSRFDSVRNPVTKYVMARISRDRAISVIEFTEVNMDAVPSIASLRKARYLGKANGLKVIWRQRGGLWMQEYICGTSAPQERVEVQ